MDRRNFYIGALLCLSVGCDLGGGGGGGPSTKPPVPPPYHLAPPLADAAARGKLLYQSQGCLLCHGPAGKGGVNNPNSDTGGKINGLLLVKEGYTPAQLAKKIGEGVSHVGRKGKTGPTPPLRMPVFEQWLDRGQIADLAAYLLSLYPKDRQPKDNWDDDDDDDDDGDAKTAPASAPDASKTPASDDQAPAKKAAPVKGSGPGAGKTGAAKTGAAKQGGVR